MALSRLLGLSLLCHGVIAGPPGLVAAEQALAERSAPRKLHGRFLHITDIHPDEFYKVRSSTDQDGACHRGRGPAGTYGAEASDCDSPFTLVNATFDWIAANLKGEIDFVVWTGDSARHDRDEELPRSQDQVLGTNKWIADKFVNLFADPDSSAMAIPVVPTFGNNDILPHNIMLPGPNRWLQRYSHIWRHFIPEEQRHSFEFGGWFNVEVIPNKLAVFSLNTLYFFDRNAGVDGCAKPSEPGYKQLEWLRVQLQFMRERGMKAILMGHVPPARTESKKLWDEECWQKYSLWMRQFRDVVVAGLYGHMNIDHFIIDDMDDIDIGVLSGSAPDFSMREAMDDELTVRSASDYLTELRDDWAQLVLPPTLAGKPDEINQDGRKRRGKKSKDPWGERYHLSFVGPSVVPTYYPTLRVVEYNITGLENVPLWKDIPKTSSPYSSLSDGTSSQKHLDLRHVPAEESDFDAEDELEITMTKNKKKKHKKKPKKPAHDPNLIIPKGPSKSSPPGPAYSPQPLTLTGYTQYFANLTHINNLTFVTPPPSDSDSSKSLLASWIPDWLLRWRNGKHGGKKPAPRPPQPREFAFEVEYSTFEDKIYRLGDLTVNSIVELAWRMGKSSPGKQAAVAAGKDDDDWEEGDCVDAGEEDDGDSDERVEVEKKKKKGKKGKKRRRKQNKTWLHFLEHAFVGTLERDELKKFSE
ncbi:Endopolyphosphatase [Madurella mycetomatis]|uniref:Endopolyphosphatase n=1 Tax=Madurella mycetomatis TaxID=100816 RepID=A0A175VV15_9PEZI|nr:Endopolyphosphatase [Madurella mycetomatis]